MIKHPMLASKITDIDKLKYPLYASPKFDGIRALTVNGQLLSRKFKPIPNKHIREMAKGLPDGLDGELILMKDITDDPNDECYGYKVRAPFNETSSAVMAEDGEPYVVFYVFDYVNDDINKPANERLEELHNLTVIDDYPFIEIVSQVLIDDKKELLMYEEAYLKAGYEGLMVRAIDSPYKEGRSTEREGYLLKLKRFEDSEAKIVGFEEKMHNDNKQEKDAFGYAKRSSKKDGLVPIGTLGKFYVVDIKSNVEFEIGTGMDDALRKEIWDNRSKYLNRLVKYKYQKCGAVDKPRFPVFLGFRDERDL